MHKERVAPKFAVQDNSTSNDRGDCNRRYQCKIVKGAFIERDNNGKFFVGVVMSFRGDLWGCN